MKKRIEFTVQGCHAIWEESITEVFVEPWPEGVKSGDIIHIGSSKVAYIVEADPEVEDLYIANCHHIPRNTRGWIEIEVEELTIIQKIKRLFC